MLFLVREEIRITSRKTSQSEYSHASSQQQDFPPPSSLLRESSGTEAESSPTRVFLIPCWVLKLFKGFIIINNWHIGLLINCTEPSYRPYYFCSFLFRVTRLRFKRLLITQSGPALAQMSWNCLAVNLFLLFCSVILMFTSAVKGESQKINLSSLNSKYLNRGIGEDNTEIMTRSVLLWFCLFVCFLLYHLFTFCFRVFVLCLHSRCFFGLSVIHSFVRCLIDSFTLIARWLP